MLQLSKFFIGCNVLSLRSGQPVASITAPIINPNNLKIEGFYCADSRRHHLVLVCQDIREVLPNGLVIDDYERLAEPDELVRLKSVMEIDFELLGKQVVTVDGQKVGKVGDYAVETGSMYIQKIYATQSILKNFTGGSLSIDRSQVHEITPKRVVITELMPKTTVPAAAPIA